MTDRIWIDISNTPQVQFFAPVVHHLRNQGHDVLVTVREKNETVSLAQMRGLNARVIGRDYSSSTAKVASLAGRTLWLAATIPSFSNSCSFENPMPIPVARLRRKPHVLILDNDVKFREGGKAQQWETRVKERSAVVLVPANMEAATRAAMPKARVKVLPGMKEHLHIHGFQRSSAPPVPLRSESYVVLRPEASESLYVNNHESLVPGLVERFQARGTPVVLLDPQDKFRLRGQSPDVIVPTMPVDGLNLIMHARAVLTGSGTMAREGAVLGVPAVSFFPGTSLLAVDRDLVAAGRVFHARDVDSIMNYLEGNPGRRHPEFEASEAMLEFVTSEILHAGGPL